MKARCTPRTMKLYDRTTDEIVSTVEKISNSRESPASSDASPCR